MRASWKYRFLAGAIVIACAALLQPLEELLQVDAIDIPSDTVKFGSIPVDVSGRGKLFCSRSSRVLIARLEIPEGRWGEVQLGLNAEIDTCRGFAQGHVAGMAADTSTAFRSVDVALDQRLPPGGGDAPCVDGTISIRTLDNVLYVGRPMYAEPYTTRRVFKYTDESGREAVPVLVKFGAVSTNTIQILAGLKAGDRVVASDDPDWDSLEHVKFY